MLRLMPWRTRIFMGRPDCVSERRLAMNRREPRQNCFDRPQRRERILDRPRRNSRTEHAARETLDLHGVLIGWSEVVNGRRKGANTLLVADLDAACDRPCLRKWEVHSQPATRAQNCELLMRRPCCRARLRRNGQ